MEIRDELRAETASLNFPALLAVLALILIWSALIPRLVWLFSFHQTLSYLAGAFLSLFVLAIFAKPRRIQRAREPKKNFPIPRAATPTPATQMLLLRLNPPKDAAIFPPPSHTSMPSARPQPHPGELGIHWRDFAPMAGILCVFAPVVLMRFVFDSNGRDIADYGWFLGLSVILALIVLARWASDRLGFSLSRSSSKRPEKSQSRPSN
jgi:flagellar biogenesis protein FliO